MAQVIDLEDEKSRRMVPVEQWPGVHEEGDMLVVRVPRQGLKRKDAVVIAKWVMGLVE